MNRNRYLPILAAAAIAILLLLILGQHFSSQQELGQIPAGEGGEMLHGPAHTSRPVEGIQPAEGIADHRFGAPDEWSVAGAMAETYTDTLSGEDFRTGRADVYLGQSLPDGPYLPWYVVGRAYPGWDTSVLPDDAKVLSATLVVALPAGGGRADPLEITIHQGTWGSPIDLDDWRSPAGPDVGRWQLPSSRMEERESLSAGQGVALHAPEPARTVRVTLNPTVVNTAGVTRLELRHTQEGTPPRVASVVLLRQTMISLEVQYRP